jgi:hypothetical protein
VALPPGVVCELPAPDVVWEPPPPDAIGVVGGPLITISPEITRLRSASGISKASAIFFRKSWSRLTRWTILKVPFFATPDIGSSDAVDPLGIHPAAASQRTTYHNHFSGWSIADKPFLTCGCGALGQAFVRMRKAKSISTLQTSRRAVRILTNLAHQAVPSRT